MNTDALKTFLEVAERGSFSAAASALGLTQPAISKRIALLESDLQVRLLDRSDKQVTLTPAGRELIPGAQTILTEMKETRRKLLGTSQSLSGSLSLATNHHIGIWRLPEILKRFQQAFSGVSIDLQFMDSEPAHSSVLESNTELALVTLAPQSVARLNSILVWTDRLVCVTAAGDPILDQDQISLANLSGYPAVLPDETTYTGRIVRQLFYREGCALTINTSTNYLETLKMLSSIGLGWTVIPESMMDSGVKEIKLDSSLPSRQLGFVHLRHRTLSRVSEAFIELTLSHSDPSDEGNDPSER